MDILTPFSMKYDPVIKDAQIDVNKMKLIIPKANPAMIFT